MQLEWLLAFLVPGLVDRRARLVSDKVGAHGARATDVVAPASDSLELYSPSTVELLRSADRVGRMCTADPETSRMPSSMPLLLGND